MASFRQPFTRSGAAPDLPSLIPAIRAVIGDPFYLGVQSDNGVLTVAVEKPTAWSAGDITNVQSAVAAAPVPSVDIAAQFTSRQKDILTTCALIARARGIPAWNALTLQQKITATFAEADIWRDMRIWAETNL